MRTPGAWECTGRFALWEPGLPTMATLRAALAGKGSIKFQA